MDGKIVNGCPVVLVNGERAARKSDLTDHAALLGEGEPTVVITGLPACRQGDRFVCPKYTEAPHVGGHIVSGSANVEIGGKPAAREKDTTLCLGEAADTAGLAASPGAGPALDADAAAECKALWAKYDKEALDLIRPAGDDHRQRNHIINGAYANLFAQNKKFVWAGLAAYASKQVGCGIDQAQAAIDEGIPGKTDMAEYTLENLGAGNRSLFLDIYPIHRFYHEHGWDKFKACAGERVPPVPAAALDGFAALERGDAHEHVRSIAFHEQLNILQRDIYNDKGMRFVLDMNEGNADDALGESWLPDVPKWVLEGAGAKPADVVMTSERSDGTPGQRKTIPFRKDGRAGNLYDVDQRMDWIMNDIGGYYLPHQGSPEHNDDIDRLRRRGSAAGGVYP